MYKLFEIDVMMALMTLCCDDVVRWDGDGDVDT